MKLQRSMSTLALLFTSVGCMVGSGWLFGAFYAAKIAGPASIVSWLIGGLLICFVALTFSELSTMLPLAGGIVRYSHFTHGTLVSFVMSWLAWLSCVAVAPTEVQAICQYSASYAPWLTHLVDGVPVLTGHGMVVATLLMLLMSYLNILGVKTLARYNNTITAWKLIIPFFTAVVIIYHRCYWGNILGTTTNGGFAPTGWHGILWALPSAGIVFSFLGFREATSMAGEAHKPGVAIPVAVIGSVFLCTVLYVLVQIAFIGALSPNMIALGWAHLSFTGDSGPFAGIAVSLGLSWLMILIYVDSLASPFGSGLIYTATTSRLNYAMSTNKYTPEWMLALNQKGVPARAVLVNFCIGLLLFLPLPTWQALVGFQSSAIVLAYGVGPLALLALRKQAPDWPRPFKLPMSYLLSVITFYICNLIAYWTGWHTLWRLMVGIVIGVVLLGVSRLFQKSEDKHGLEIKSALWLIPYMGGLCVISYLGTFGGGTKAIPFGWDFLVIAIFTVIIMQLAMWSRLPSAETLQALPSDKELNLIV